MDYLLVWLYQLLQLFSENLNGVLPTFTNFTYFFMAVIFDFEEFTTVKAIKMLTFLAVN
jgi:hypothetical protein